MSATKLRTNLAGVWRFAFVHVILILALGGCRSAPDPGVTLVHEPGSKSQTCRVPYSATYALFSLDKTPNPAIFIGHAAVERDGHVGFTPQADGTLDAFAGAFKVSVPEGRYIWQIDLETEKDQREMRRDEIAGHLGTGFSIVGSALAIVGELLVKFIGIAIYALAKAGGP